MVKLDSPARLSHIVPDTLLVQTDTTVGFLSQNAQKLYTIKSRDTKKPFIRVFQDFKTLKEHHIRVPNTQKNRVRRSKKTTFIVKNSAFRVAKYNSSSSYLRHEKWHFSTSANESTKNFSRDFCEQKTDIIIEDKHGLFEGPPSKLYKINHKRIKRLR